MIFTMWLMKLSFCHTVIISAAYNAHIGLSLQMSLGRLNPGPSLPIVNGV